MLFNTEIIAKKINLQMRQKQLRKIPRPLIFKIGVLSFQTFIIRKGIINFLFIKPNNYLLNIWL